MVEQVPEFPDRWFNTAFIIGPSGQCHPEATTNGTFRLRLVSGRAHTTSWKIMARVFGTDISQLFPVVDTEIGKLGTMTCHDGCTPEVSRALGYNGCEVICHPVALQEIEGVSSALGFLDVLSPYTRARQHVLSAGIELGDRRLRVLSALVLPWTTRSSSITPAWCCGEADYPSEQVISATIDIESLARASLPLQPQHLGGCSHGRFSANI